MKNTDDVSQFARLFVCAAAKTCGQTKEQCTHAGPHEHRDQSGCGSNWCTRLACKLTESHPIRKPMIALEAPLMGEVMAVVNEAVAKHRCAAPVCQEIK